jgi:hypothetical protein
LVKMNYTPGPWEVSKDKERSNLIIMPELSVSGIGQKYVAVGGGNIEANAKLISAAPELLEALIEIIKYSFLEAREENMAKKAIAKATNTEQ